MPTLDASWSPQIRQIGELEKADHWYLSDGDLCYFFGEYTARAGFGHSSTNQIIANIKKKPNLRYTQQWPHKVRAIRRVAEAICGAIRPESLAEITIVPIPPSKQRNHPDYDGRMAAIARGISPEADVRELIEVTGDREALHESEQRLKPDELQMFLRLEEALCQPAPRQIMLIDDVITTGCSFIACRSLLQQRFPGVPVSGIFAARRVLDKAVEFPEIDL